MITKVKILALLDDFRNIHPAPAGHSWHVDIYRPGNHRLYRLELRTNNHHLLGMFPNEHLEGVPFYWFLKGLLLTNSINKTISIANL